MKFRLKWYPYSLFLLTAILLLAIAVCSWGKTIDLVSHDSSLVMPLGYIWLALAFVFSFLWALYKLTHRLLWTKKLTWVHVGTTLLVFLLLLTIQYWGVLWLYPQREAVLTYESMQHIDKNAQWSAIAIIAIFGIGQLSYFINLIGGLVKRSRY